MTRAITTENLQLPKAREWFLKLLRVWTFPDSERVVSSSEQVVRALPMCIIFARHQIIAVTTVA